MMKFPVLITLLILAGCSHPPATPPDQPPAWSKNVVWYQIFVERFNNGDPSNDPKPENINIAPLNQFAPAGWSVTPCSHNWYEREPWAQDPTRDFYHNLQYRRFGGDLQGVMDKLDYLQDLGVTAIYFNPLNDAPSLHKYDARSYHHIDVNFGPDPAGDLLIIASENPADPATWQWTSADNMFLRVIEEAHQRGMKVILDYSWNHTGVLFWAWQDILKNQVSSAYKDWYDILAFDDPNTPENEFRYKGWLNVESLPELKKTDISTPRENGHPYEGDINPGAKQHIFDVTRRWLAPDGDTSKGVDGFRLDVADQVGLKFWRDYRKFVRSVEPDAYLVGEIWWEKWPDNLMNPAPYTQGDIFDAVMFYHVYRPARYFFAKTDFAIDARQLRDSLEFQWNRLRPENLHAMMNFSSSHDAPRLLTDFNNPNKYKFRANPRDDSTFKTGKPDEEAYRRLKLYLVHLFTTTGNPVIWNGEEMGMWGNDDPDCRKPLWWEGIRTDPEYRNNYQPGTILYDTTGFNREQYDLFKKLITIRRENPVLVDGKLEFLVTEGKKLCYKRSDEKGELLVLFNADTIPGTFNLPADREYNDLLSGTPITSKSVIIPPLTAMILK